MASPTETYALTGDRATAALALLGHGDEGQLLVKRLLDFRNDAGPRSEQGDVAGKRLVGNFPPVFPRIALANAAHTRVRAAAIAPARAR